MVLFVDLDDEDALPDSHLILQGHHLAHNGALLSEKPVYSYAAGPDLLDKPPAFRSAVTEAFGCYPVVINIASSIDLNTLDSLARTCRQVRQSLLQHRAILLSSTLRCENHELPVDSEDALRFRARAGNYWYDEARHASVHGKSGECARDMVSECRRCAMVVCRNCAIKPPAYPILRERYRRLCRTCGAEPLPALAKPPLDPCTPFDSDTLRGVVCKCEAEGVFLCMPCGRAIRGNDHEYIRIWRWRLQYGEVLGGLGTGIGDGDRGVVCGRDEDCCRAKDREQEVDSEAEAARRFGSAAWRAVLTPPPDAVPGDSTGNGNGNVNSNSNGSDALAFNLDTTPSTHGAASDPADLPTPGHWSDDESASSQRAGYETHEMLSIGGMMKKKKTVMVRVGACVPEWEDEKTRCEKILGRELSGRVRSWCGWCRRVIPSDGEREKMALPALSRKR